MDVIPYLIDAIVVLLPAAMLYSLGRARGVMIGLKRAGVPQKPVCTCGHGYGVHNRGGHCNEEEILQINYKEKVFPCKCLYYDGPEPLPRTWKPEEIEGGPR
jgi:hypothetical protein